MLTIRESLCFVGATLLLATAGCQRDQPGERPGARDSTASEAADKRPVYLMNADGSNPHVIDVLHYQSGIDGSRAEWRPAIGARPFAPRQ